MNVCEGKPNQKPALVIVGPTASGKSGLALAIAQEFAGTVINADSMQVYTELRILTARPKEADEAAVPHRLYGFLPASNACSAALWSEWAGAEMRRVWGAGSLPVLAGGTGFYIKAITEGLSKIPPVPDAVRKEVQALRAEVGPHAFHTRLAEVDATAAARLPAADAQRCLRAMEVFEATGRSITDWNAGADILPVPEARFFTIFLDPPREVLNAASDARFNSMLGDGALAEAAALDTLGLSATLPIMKSLGLQELLAHLQGMISLEEASAAAKQSTRRFAKRQQTWFRNQIQPNIQLTTQYSERFLEEIFSKICKFLLTAQK
ncbi:MAG: tRNA (adenosine(37)-N6)-dimethylallyltransferase MiaA [Pseudomonadota bacterium]|nr:tRNA (adenosine(37)-N6)-dimethylallyltransferase MiaA [Pseudomonadota bacterium]